MLSQHMMANTTDVRKTALVTGGARGIGKAIVMELADAGYNLIVNYNTSEEEALMLKDSLDNKGVSCLMIKADISSEVDVANMVDLAISKYGRIDVLVNNAAYCNDAMFYDKKREEFIKTLETNVVGTWQLSRLVGEGMYHNGGGKIINIASTNGINTYYPLCIDYDASKAAIISLTHNLATQFKPYVNVNAIAPGFIATDSEVGAMDDEFVKLEEEKVMLGRAGRPEEVAKLVAFLASSDSDFINNQVIAIIGGVYGDV